MTNLIDRLEWLKGVTFEGDKLFAATVLAEQAHWGQHYGEHDYFDYHIKGVRDLSREMYDNSIIDTVLISKLDVTTVAILHDVIEDSDVTKEQIEYIFGEKIALWVDLLTKKKNQRNDVYLVNLSQYEVPWLVKVADTSFNLQESIKVFDKNRIKKYSSQLECLMDLRS